MAPVFPFRTRQIRSIEFDEKPEVFQVYTERQLDKIEALKQLSETQRFEIKVVANVLPFRVNQYVINHLIDWSNIPDDPIFRLVFPQKEMLFENDFEQMADVLRRTNDRSQIIQKANEIRRKLNPHPAE